MSRIADNLYEFSNNVFTSIGFGNDNMAKAFCLGALISPLAILGFYFPPLGIAMHWMLPLLIGGTTFGGVSLLTNFEPMGVLAGFILSLFTGGLAYAFCASLIYIAPAATTLIASPNFVAGGSYVLGGIFSCLDGVWTGIKGCCSAIGQCLCCCFRDSANDEPTQQKTRQPIVDRGNANMRRTLSPSPYTGSLPSPSATTDPAITGYFNLLESILNPQRTYGTTGEPLQPQNTGTNDLSGQNRNGFGMGGKQ